MLLKILPKSSLAAAASVFALACAVGAGAQQAPGQAARPAAPQLPPRDVTKLPTTLAEAAAAQPSNPAWPQAYKPRSKRDFTGVWEAPPRAAPARPAPGQAQAGRQRRAGVAMPLTPDYAAIFKQRTDDRAAGKVTADPTANCLPGGMPHMMTNSPFPMEIMMNERQVNLFREYQEQTRRIFTDGRKLNPDGDLTYNGASVGHWEGNVLMVTTIGLRGDTNLDAAATPHSDKLIVYERFWLSDDNTLNDELTLVDPKALLKPVIESRSWVRGKPGLSILPYMCTENNRNPIGANGQTSLILK
ncbi:MAG: hypothetical protein JWO72_917 [Caulobacteraceae bacterium]|nr:hypothetical protein [Caulobacteraceae bacterium]